MEPSEAVDEPSHYSVLFTYAVGLSLVAAAICLLLWNEHRAGSLCKALDQALEQVVHIEEDEAVPTNATQLIHVTGHLSSRQVAVDEVYNVSVAAVKLRRLVEMYQWVEKSIYRQYSDSDGISMEQDYAYELDWRSELVDSTPFTKISCVNPKEFPVESKEFVLTDVHLGQLQLSDSLVSMVSNFRPLDEVVGVGDAREKYIYMTSSGGTLESPQVGDVRISFHVAGVLGPHGDQVSIVSECDGRRLRPFISTAGVLVELLELGDVTARVMFKQAYADNGLSTFLFRSIAWFVSFMGFSLLSPVLHVPSDALPWLRLLIPAESSPMEFSVYAWLLFVLCGWAISRPLHAASALLACVVPFVTARRLHHHHSA